MLVAKSFDKLFSVRNKKILITGSTGYFGQIISEELLRRGANIIINGRNENKLLKLKKN